MTFLTVKCDRARRLVLPSVRPEQLRLRVRLKGLVGGPSEEAPESSVNPRIGGGDVVVPGDVDVPVALLLLGHLSRSSPRLRLHSVIVFDPPSSSSCDHFVAASAPLSRLPLAAGKLDSAR